MYIYNYIYTFGERERERETQFQDIPSVQNTVILGSTWILSLLSPLSQLRLLDIQPTPTSIIYMKGPLEMICYSNQYTHWKCDQDGVYPFWISQDESFKKKRVPWSILIDHHFLG